MKRFERKFRTGCAARPRSATAPDQSLSCLRSAHSVQPVGIYPLFHRTGCVMILHPLSAEGGRPSTGTLHLRRKRAQSRSLPLSQRVEPRPSAICSSRAIARRRRRWLRHTHSGARSAAPPRSRLRRESSRRPVGPSPDPRDLLDAGRAEVWPCRSPLPPRSGRCRPCAEAEQMSTLVDDGYGHIPPVFQGLGLAGLQNLFTSVKDRHRFVRMITPREICFTVLMANGLTVGCSHP